VGRAPSLGDGWLKVPLYPHPLRGQKIWNVLGWFPGHRLVHRVGVDFRAPAQPAAQAPGVRRPPAGPGRSVRLPISDTPSEMTEVYRAFNQMAETSNRPGASAS
jgi:two-component system osmolarity sensor histidine kinase EnvZ